MTTSPVRRGASPWVLLVLATLVGIGSWCGAARARADAPARGDDDPRVLFPLRDVVASVELRTLPVVLGGGWPGATAWIRAGDAAPMPVVLEGVTTRVDLPLVEGERTVTVLSPQQRVLRTFRLEVVAEAEAKDRLLRQRQGAGEQEPGAGAPQGLDLVALPVTGDWPIFLDDQPPFIFSFADVFCLTDVDVHHPISQDPAEPLVPEAEDFSHGAWTLRNDDADWTIGANVATDALPIAFVATDLDQAPDAGENDLVKVDAVNLFALPRVYLFAFTLEAEADRALGTDVRSVNGRRSTTAELGTYADATKGGAAAPFPLSVPGPGTSVWVEGRLGGTYRLVVGQLPDGVAPDAVTYDKRNQATRPPLACMRQATLTVAVVDIYQEASGPHRRLTAFDVYWGARPHFRAEVWPSRGHYEWAAAYRIGAAVRNVPGVAVSGEVAHMNRDSIEGEPSAGASHSGHAVQASGDAGGGNKATIAGGIRVHRPQVGSSPTVNTAATNRYPERISVAYEVQGERLVRPEPLEVILPRLHAVPPALTVEGSAREVESTVQYQMEDAFGRLITARNVDQYLHFYGAGLKAWEALGTDTSTLEGGRRNDELRLTRVGAGLAALPLETAQRSQAKVHSDRMTAASFTDTLRFRSRHGANDRFADWNVWAGTATAAALAARRQEAVDRVRDLANPALVAGVQAADAASSTAHPVFSIPQDVILQLRTGDDRDDLMVLEGSTLAVHAPHFFENMPDGNHPAPKHFHLTFTPGAATSQLVDVNRRRTPPP